MNPIRMHYAYWWVLQIAKKLGFWGLLGLVLIIISLVFYAVKLPNIEKSILALSTEHPPGASQLLAENSTPESQALDNATEISRFYQQFPSAASLPETLLQMNKIASEQGLALNSGDYKLNRFKKLSSAKPLKSNGLPALTRYEITLPIQGRYPQIRTFLAKVLEQNPALALTDLQFKRENTLDAQIEAHLVFVLFTKGET